MEVLVLETGIPNRDSLLTVASLVLSTDLVANENGALDCVDGLAPTNDVVLGRESNLNGRVPNNASFVTDGSILSAALVPKENDALDCPPVLNNGFA